MSEHERRQENIEDRHENMAEQHAEQQERLRQTIEAAKKAKETSPQEVEKLLNEAKEKALSQEHSKAEIGKESKEHHPMVIDRTVKQQAYKKTLRRVQSQLPRRERTFSKIIHQDTVEKISEVTGKTLARPSGLLGGGVFALLGTTVVVWMSRHYGFRYNYFVFIALVLAGFAVGLLLESIVKATRKVSKR